MRKLIVAALFLVFVFTFGQVAGGPALAAQDVHWTYEGHEGPEHWGELSKDYAACSEGHEQSPINIPSSAPTNPFGILFNYMPSKLNVVNNGHTIQINYDAGSSIMVDGETYDLLQFHFHAQSEHTIKGKYSPMEVHFVHRSASGKLAVVGALMSQGAENAAYAPVMSNLPATASGVQTVPGVTIDADDLLPVDHDYYRYNGSLTTPPCSEGVKWLLMSHPLELSGAQITAYTTIYAHTNRPVQPFYDRTFFVGGKAVVGMPKSGNENSTAWLVVLGVIGFASLGGGVALSRRKS
ncbi:MAG TPA: carbonic anhydrase family protein [Chloroflexia bacterium]|jgi:carbonic anhydrase